MRLYQKVAIVVGVVVLVLSGAGLGLRAWLRQREITEYGGQCGRARRCQVDGLGLTKRCRFAPDWNTVWGIAPFADESACGDDWVPMVARLGPVIAGRGRGVGDYGGAGEVVEELSMSRRRWGDASARAQLGTSLRQARWEAPGVTAPYQVGSCGEYTSNFDANTPRIVIVGNLDADPDLDCWVLLEDGTIRHVQRD